MQCTRPVWLYDLSMYVPCGRCTACKIAHSREWSVRLIHEMEYHENSYFYTFTYNTDHLPDNGSLNKEEFQKFVKRLRIYISRRGDRTWNVNELCYENAKIKYFACGEYGEKNKRPHYHAIIMGFDDRSLYYDCEIKQNRSKDMERIWAKGNVIVGSVTYDSCRYVADYTFKKYTEKYNREVYGDKQPPFQLQSLRMGERYVFDNANQIIENRQITFRGKNVGIPLYYKRKLKLDMSSDAREHLDSLKEAYNTSDSPDNEIYIKRWREALRQKEASIMAREALKGKNKLD